MSLEEPPAATQRDATAATQRDARAAAQRDAILSLELVAGLPEPIRELVAASFVELDFAFGDTVVAAGDPADAVYVVLAGRARVLTTGDDGNEVSLNMLGPGDSFGELALLEGSRRTATVRASSPLTAARLDGGLFHALMARYPEIAAALRRNAQVRPINDFLRAHSAFSALNADESAWLLERLVPLRLADGETVVSQGDPGDSMYLIQDGRVGVFIERGGISARVRTMRSGEFFGELALLDAGPRTATVKAEGELALLRLGRADFEQLMHDSPAFRSRIAERVALYRARDSRPESEPAETAAAQAWDAADPGLAITESGEQEGGSDAPPPPPPRRFPFLRQIDQMDCGAACLGMICRSFGHEVSMTSIRYAVGTGTQGTTLRGLVHGGTELGLKMRAVKSSIDRIGALPLPAIIHWDSNHWIVAYRVSDSHLWVADPGRGLRRLPLAEVEEKWSGFAATAAPTPKLAEAPRGGLRLGWVWPYIRPYRTRLLVAFLLALAAAGFEMLLPVFSQVVIDRVVGHHDGHLLGLLALGMAATLGLAVTVTLLQRRLLARISTVLDAELLDFISGRLLALPMRYFEARRTGDIERRLSGMQQVRQVLVASGVNAGTAATQLVVAIVIMFSYSLLLGLLYVACAPLYGLLLRYSAKHMRPVFDAVEAGHGQYQSRQIDAIRGIATVKAMGVEGGLRRRMAAEFGLLHEKLFRAAVVGMTYEGLVSTVTYMVYGAFLFVAAELALHHQLTIGEFVSFNALVLLANAPLMTLLGLWDQLQMVSVLMGRVQDVLESEPEQGRDHSGLTTVGELEGHVRLRRVSFAYPSSPDRQILENVTLDVPAGATVALVGRSGSGKSTLVKLVAGLLTPTAGAVEYDGQDIAGLELAQLRRRIGFVLQDPYLFDDTIAANIAFGEDEIDQLKVVQAAEIADAAGFIAGLPLGYETRVGDSGLKLSGGQAQRVAIARALYHQPPVLIFDEATSALDSEAERAVKENMDRVLRGRTAFVIAHRLSTIRGADLICVMEGGRIVEQGSHEELLRRQGLYAYLLSQQLDA